LSLGRLGSGILPETLPDALAESGRHARTDWRGTRQRSHLGRRRLQPHGGRRGSAGAGAGVSVGPVQGGSVRSLHLPPSRTARSGGVLPHLPRSEAPLGPLAGPTRCLSALDRSGRSSQPGVLEASKDRAALLSVLAAAGRRAVSFKLTSPQATAHPRLHGPVAHAGRHRQRAACPWSTRRLPSPKVRVAPSPTHRVEGAGSFAQRPPAPLDAVGAQLSEVFSAARNGRSAGSCGPVGRIARLGAGGGRRGSRTA
jgi:hypothetical protein